MQECFLSATMLEEWLNILAKTAVNQAIVFTNVTENSKCKDQESILSSTTPDPRFESHVVGTCVIGQIISVRKVLRANRNVSGKLGMKLTVANCS